MAAQGDVFTETVLHCRSCQHYKERSEFQLNATVSSVPRCKTCARRANEASKRKNLRVMRTILRQIRMREDNHAGGAQIVYLLQESDIDFLLRKIWNNQSIISGANRLS
eukprot:Clim_evm7s157 gene=Clim_evmTU7s157